MSVSLPGDPGGPGSPSDTPLGSLVGARAKYRSKVGARSGRAVYGLTATTPSFRQSRQNQAQFHQSRFRTHGFLLSIDILRHGAVKHRL